MQYSLSGGVVVQVTGIMQRGAGGAKRPFVQTFFLAVQEKGYYVLNDVFRCGWGWGGIVRVCGGGAAGRGVEESHSSRICLCFTW